MEHETTVVRSANVQVSEFEYPDRDGIRAHLTLPSPDLHS